MKDEKNLPKILRKMIERLRIRNRELNLRIKRLEKFIRYPLSLPNNDAGLYEEVIEWRRAAEEYLVTKKP